MIFRTKWKSRLVKLVHFFPFSNIYKHLKSCCRHTAHELAQHNQHRVVIQRSFPCSLGLVVNLSLVGTGLEGAFCKLTSIRARSISVFLPVREHLEGIRVCSQDMLFEDPGGSMKTLLTTKPSPTSLWRPEDTYLFGGTFCHHQQGRKAVLLVCSYP